MRHAVQYHTAAPNDYINLNVLKTYAAMFPEVVLGLSDHTRNNATVLGRLAWRVVERRHRQRREGPGVRFALNPAVGAHDCGKHACSARSGCRWFIAGTNADYRRSAPLPAPARDIMAGEVFTAT
jgi:hypothetical protein